MAKKTKKKVLKSKKVDKKVDKKIDKKVDKDTTQTKSPKGYKRGDLGKAIYAYFDKVSIDKATYDKAFEIAQKILPRTKFNKYHYSWYKNKYNLRD